MIKKILRQIVRFARGVRKDLDALLDHTEPHGWVEVRLIHANGPKRGQIAKSQITPMHVPVLGRNVVTGFLTGPPYSGRDIMRRKIVHSDFTGYLTGDDYTIRRIQLGAGSTAETSSDTSLESPLASNSIKEISSVEFDAANPYVTFVATWDENEGNLSISEAGLWGPDISADASFANDHFWARKTFEAFTKNNNFTLQLRWTIRF